MVQVLGLKMDKETRCLHYHSPLDIVALKCFSCQTYAACYQCHDALSDHSFAPYPSSRSKDKVLLCGACQTEMTISLYRTSPSCPSCHKPFNPACKNHDHIYFKD